MAKTNTIKVSMVKGYEGYSLDPIHYARIEDVYTYSRDTMRRPCAIHLISHVYDIQLFETTKSKGLMKEFKRALKRQYKPSSTSDKPKSGKRQKAPNTLVIYSLEYKLTSQQEIDGNGDAYKYGYKKTKELLPFLHIHVHVIADCTDCKAPSFPNYAKDAMNDLDGLRATRYAPTKPKKVKNKDGIYEYKKMLYKKLNTDFDDSVLRAFYLAKTDQKPPEGMIQGDLFNTSKIKKLSVVS